MNQFSWNHSFSCFESTTFRLLGPINQHYLTIPHTPPCYGPSCTYPCRSQGQPPGCISTPSKNATQLAWPHPNMHSRSPKWGEAKMHPPPQFGPPPIRNTHLHVGPQQTVSRLKSNNGVPVYPIMQQGGLAINRLTNGPPPFLNIC